MAHIVLFHSILGLRSIERDLAREWEEWGHTVTLPDLYGGLRAQDYDAGFAIYRDVGGDTVRARAMSAAEALPQDAVLAGVSMGAGLVGGLWGDRLRSKGALLIAGAAPWSPELRSGIPVQSHIARPDPFDDEEFFADWVEMNPGAALDLHRYDDVGHYFLDPSLSDYGEKAARDCRAAMLEFLAGL
jgi:dienelactone hydrolase